MKLLRNSQETYIDEKDKERYVKLKEAKLLKGQSFPIPKLTLKGKCYQNASILVEYGDFIIEEHTYIAVRITLKDRFGQRIFKEPMLLLAINLSRYTILKYLINDGLLKIDGFV